MLWTSPSPTDSAGASPLAGVRVLAITVNRACEFACPHCDLPTRYRVRAPELDEAGWRRLLRHVATLADYRLAAVSAREPLLSESSRGKTLAIIQESRELGRLSSVVTSGNQLSAFIPLLRQHALRLDCLDVSVDGPPNVDARIRDAGHIGRVAAALADPALSQVAPRTFVSFVLQSWNCEPSILAQFVDWITATMPVPRLAVLPVYPNEHVPKELWLDDAQFERALDVLVAVSDRLEELVINVLPGGIRGFAGLVERGILPGDDELARAGDGALWGHLDRNVLVRYDNHLDLARSTLRLTPEGLAIPPRGVELEDYRSAGALTVFDDTFPARFESMVRDVEQESFHHLAACGGGVCASACQGFNARCGLREIGRASCCA